jgi:hypothetical protein
MSYVFFEVVAAVWTVVDDLCLTDISINIVFRVRIRSGFLAVDRLNILGYSLT